MLRAMRNSHVEAIATSFVQPGTEAFLLGRTQGVYLGLTMAEKAIEDILKEDEGNGKD